MNTSKHNIYPMINLFDLENNIFHIGQKVSWLSKILQNMTKLLLFVFHIYIPKLNILWYHTFYR
jgi:hypothetical protein